VTVDRVISVMAQVFEIPPSSISPDAEQESIERWDSLGHMNLCVALEEAFSVSFDDQQVSSMTSVPLIVETIEKMQRA
jgi:acyl carrier protein